MSRDEKAIEAEIQAKGKTAPRLTPDIIDGKIKAERFFFVPERAVTICALTLENGFVVTGESAPVSVENFDMEIGRKIARAKAREKIWALEGYLLRERLHVSERIAGV